MPTLEFQRQHPSNFKDDEIREDLRQTRSRHKNVNHDRVKPMHDLKLLAEFGQEEEFEAKLIEAGIHRGSP